MGCQERPERYNVPMIEHAPKSEVPVRTLVERLKNPNRIGSLTDKEFKLALKAVLDAMASNLEKPDEEAKWIRRWEVARRIPASKEVAKEEPTPVEVVSMEDYYKGPWTEQLTNEELGRVKGILGTDYGFIEATDPQVLMGGMEIRVKLTESSLSQEAMLIGKNPEEDGEFLIHFVRSDDPESTLSVPLNMILVPPPVQEQEIIEEAADVVTPPSPEPTPEVPMNVFRIGDYVSATAQFPDGSIQDITGQIVYAGIVPGATPKEDLYEAGICFSDTPSAPQRIAFVHDRNALRLVEGARAAQQIYDRTNFSPTELVQIAGDENATYHVVGVADTGDLELVPTDAFNDPTVKKMLIRIVLAQRGTSKDDPETINRLQADVRQLLEPKIIQRPKTEISVARKLKEFKKEEFEKK
jgi:hypothetical protein